MISVRYSKEWFQDAHFTKAHTVRNVAAISCRAVDIISHYHRITNRELNTVFAPSKTSTAVTTNCSEPRLSKPQREIMADFGPN